MQVQRFERSSVRQNQNSEITTMVNFTFIAVLGFAVFAATKAAAVPPGFDLLGEIEIRSNNGIGLSTVSRKTLFLSREVADWHDAHTACYETTFNGRMLTIADPDEGQRVYNLLVQNRIQSAALWTAGERVGEEWTWNTTPRTAMPNFLWTPPEPNPDPYYDVAVFVKSNIGWSFQAYPRYAMYLNRYICEVIASD